MKVRIREKRIKSGVSYCIQVKRGLFWKTLTDTNVLDDAIKIVDDLKRMDKVNNREQVVMNGWMVRDQFSSGIGHKLNVYSDKPTYKKNVDLDMIYWDGNEIASIATESNLFGDKGLEPRMVKIIIEKL